jgi:tripeptidyl-peptidase-1
METDVKVTGRTHPDWVDRGLPEPTAIHHVVFALKHDAAKLKQLDTIFWEVSDPKHKNYGKYLSFEELGNLMAAPQAHIDIVGWYLTQFGVAGKINPNKDMIDADVPVATLEKMLNTKLGKFERMIDNQELIRATQAYYLPEEVAACVDIVGNLLDFPNWGAPRIVENVGAVGNWPNYCGSSCSGKITPQVIQQQYNSTNYTPSNPKNSVAVAEFQGQQYDPTDINMFTTACSLPAETIVSKLAPNGGADCAAGGCVESLLDLEFMHGIAPHDLPVNDYWLSTYSLLDWINDVLADVNASLVHSVSYGNDESQQTSTSYMYSCNTQFQADATRGLSILFASGDQGVWGREGHNGHFNPDFPAGSPYITAVGGSDLDGTTIGSPEICCQDSGGGFSITFSQPSYQTQAVTSYLNNPAANLPPSTYYNSFGRAYPDISAIFGLYIPYCIAEAGRWVGVAGTSASCPVVAGIIANLNNVQLNAGKPQLGFLNPWLYQTYYSNPSAFYDITQGCNNGGSGACFTAIAGWDPCSGVGRPIQGNMQKYLP